jgi:hypothetical protein
MFPGKIRIGPGSYTRHPLVLTDRDTSSDVRRYDGYRLGIARMVLSGNLWSKYVYCLEDPMLRNEDRGRRF